MTNDKLKMTNDGINYLNKSAKRFMHLTLFIGHLSLAVILGFFSLSYASPTISVTINGATPYPGDPISNTPTISITATSTVAVTSITANITGIASSPAIVNSGNNYYATYEVSSALSDGTYTLTIEATDTQTATYEVVPLYVQNSNAPATIGTPLNYPNPFDPGTQTTAIGYSLSKPGNVSLNIFDLAGNLITKQAYSANQNGGRAGYNEITWDGKSGAGDYVGNGIYIYLLIIDGQMATNGKGKITVFK